MLSSRPSDTGTAKGSGSSGLSGATGTATAASSSGADKLRAVQLLGSVRYGRLAMSMRALPFLAVARHLVIEGRVVLRMHRGLGFHESCDGSVIAYGADNFNSPVTGGTEDLWSVQFTGPVEIVDPALDERERFGNGPAEVNGEHFDPVYLRLDPHLAHMHTLAFAASP
ncbi:pyridoxamine 5'-phosphate oxidase family protein [Streptomyces sp. NPDC060209]|uniref:pyridoxamine 5'-phosphate oxidase family protein n=1 Tax=Streptomyces sp. NPDC060209 TaxID=3347073 RepID=UPI00365FEC90